MRALLAERFDKQVRGVVEDARLVEEAGRARYMAFDSHERHESIEAGEFGFDLREHVERRESCGLAAFRFAELRTDSARVLELAFE